VAPFPLGCQINTDIDNTNDISNVDQPPLLMMHGTADTIIPYMNGKKVFMRAQAVGLESALITMQGAGHVPWNVIFNQSTFFHDALSSISSGMDLVHAQAPAGCIAPGIAKQQKGLLKGTQKLGTCLPCCVLPPDGQPCCCPPPGCPVPPSCSPPPTPTPMLP
jgi:hypothetical protein